MPRPENRRVQKGGSDAGNPDDVVCFGSVGLW